MEQMMEAVVEQQGTRFALQMKEMKVQLVQDLMTMQ